MKEVIREQALTLPIAGETAIGILHEASVVSGIAVLIIVGGPQTRVGSHRQFVLLARRLAAAGYPVLRFDYRGIGDSSGAARDFEAVDDDIRAAIDMLAGRTGAGRIVLWGLCDAASAAMMYAPRDARVSALVLANPWVHSPRTEAKARLKSYYWERLGSRDFWRKVLRLEFDWRDSLVSLTGYLRRALARGPVAGASNGRHFIERMHDGWQQFVGPSLLLLSGQDLTAEEFRGLCTDEPSWSALSARSGVTTVPLPEANHTFSSAASRADVEEATLAWLRTLPGRI